MANSVAGQLDGEAHKCRRALKWSSSRLRARRRAFAKNRTVCRPAQRVRRWPRMTGACVRPPLPNSNISPNSHFISGRVRMTALVAAIFHIGVLAPGDECDRRTARKGLAATTSGPGSGAASALAGKRQWCCRIVAVPP